jgi:tartrate dehydrogenase/decarboxylase/D-malate dehydrogenase
MKIYKIASIPGDGIGKEVIPEGEKVLAAISKRFPEITFQCERFDGCGDYYRKTGKMMPDDSQEIPLNNNYLMAVRACHMLPSKLSQNH